MAFEKRHGSGFAAATIALVVGAGLWVSAFQGPGGPGQGRGGGGAGQFPGPPPGGQGGGRGGPGGGPGGGGGGRAQGPGGGGPARDPNTPAPVGTGSVAGAVTLEGASSPVRRAQVTLSGAELRGTRSTTTNDRGQFSFVALPAGRFTLTVSKPGYVGISYGAKKPGRAGTPIQLAEGQKLTNANVSLPRGSVLTGVVVDEAGEPSPNTQVRAYRYVMSNGQRTLQMSNQDQTDDRGLYRIFQLQPGEYMVSASPRNQGTAGDARQQLQAQLEPLLQQVQAARGATAAAGAPGAGARAAAGVAAGGGGRQGLGAIGNLLDSNRGQKLIEQVQQLQQQLQQQPDEQATAYAPVYYPGTTMPASAAKVTLGVGEERSGIDFQLQLVPTARVQGTVLGAEGALTQGAQIALQVAGQQDAPIVPGVSTNMARINQDGKFSFQNVAPGQYTLMVRAAIRQPVDPQAAQAPQAVAGGRGAGALGGRGRAGGAGAITQVLWASSDITVDGRDLSDLTLSLQPGMTVTGRMTVEAGSTQPPSDWSRSRVTLTSVGSPAMDIGPPPPPQVDATGNFTITGVAPGRYALRGNVVVAAAQGTAAGTAGPGALAALVGRAGGAGAAGGWNLKSALVNGVDALDFPLDIKPNENINGAVLTFTDKSQELSGTLQDSTGKPTADYTIILFASDNRFWTPLSRRILSTRPGTDGKFVFRNLPAGQYRLTAVTDAEQGEWFDPAFLSQIGAASISVTIADGEKRVQDIRLAGQ